MDTLKCLIEILFLISSVHVSMVESRKKYPRIQDVICFSHEADQPTLQTRHEYIPSVVNILKTRIDVKQFRTNETSFRRHVRDFLEDNVALKPDGRRVQVYKAGGDDNYFKATKLQLQTKSLDSMLQLVYMARHYYKQFERHQYVDKTSISFRVGIVSLKIRALFQKAVKIFEILNIRQKNKKWETAESVSGPLVLHHKVAKIHVDFLYFYEVLHRLHRKVKVNEIPQYLVELYQIPPHNIIPV